MKHWCIQFEHTETGKKMYREYPQIGQFETLKKLSEWLFEQQIKGYDWINGYVAMRVELIDLENEKCKQAGELGKLIYN